MARTGKYHNRYHTKWSHWERMDPEITKLSEVNQRQVSYVIPYVWNLKTDTNELIYKAEINSQT